MSIYFGNTGNVELRRKADHAAYPTLEKSDVNVAKRRFTTSAEANQVFLIGDEIGIARIDKNPDNSFKNLELVKDHIYPDWRGFISIDELGGIRLYKRFSDAIEGNRLAALELVEPTEAQNLKIKTRNTAWRCLARVKSFDFTTEREQVDITSLRENFKTQYDAGLISGQGSLECFWEHKPGLCVYNDSGDINLVEFPVYLSQLCIRLVQGADFWGRFFIYKGNELNNIQSVWYEAECIITNCTVNVPADGVVEASINFLTSKRVALRTGYPPLELLDTDGSLILQEDAESIYVGIQDE